MNKPPCRGWPGAVNGGRHSVVELVEVRTGTICDGRVRPSAILRTAVLAFRPFRTVSAMHNRQRATGFRRPYIDRPLERALVGEQPRVLVPQRLAVRLDRLLLRVE